MRVNYTLYTPSPSGTTSRLTPPAKATSPKTGEELNTLASMIAMMTAKVFALSPWSRGTSKAEGVRNRVAKQNHRPKKKGEWWKSSRINSILFFVLLFLLTACEHRPLEDPANVHYLRIYIDEQIQNVTYGFYNEQHLRPEHRRPVVLRACLCDPHTGNIAAEHYLQEFGEDERGYYIAGTITANPGNYRLLVYNIGTESTLIRQKQDYLQAEAYTNRIASHYYAYLPSVRTGKDKEKIVYEPDHLFLVNDEEIRIAPTQRIDTLRRTNGEYFTAVTCVDSYYLQVGIKGIEYISTAASLLTGLSPAVTLHNRGLHPEDPVQIFFEMNLSGRENEVRTTEDGRSVIYTTFNTFGKLPEVTTELEVTFDFVTTDGRTQTERIDITPMFDTPQVIDHKWIIIDREIVIDPPAPSTGGGLSPEVNEWDNIETDLNI